MWYVVVGWYIVGVVVGQVVVDVYIVVVVVVQYVVDFQCFYFYYVVDVVGCVYVQIGVFGDGQVGNQVWVQVGVLGLVGIVVVGVYC